MDYKHDKVDLIVGNPPFTKISGSYRMHLLRNNHNKNSTNLAEFILEKSNFKLKICVYNFAQKHPEHTRV